MNTKKTEVHDMLLIRGIYGSKHALKINEGLIGCRDVQSSLMDGNHTGYRLSNYHEALFMNTRFTRVLYDETVDALPDRWRRLALIMADHFLAESYLCYFHILNAESSFCWLERNWRDDAHFIYYEPRCEYESSVIGNRYCGQAMRYVNSAEEINVRETIAANPGTVVVLLDQEMYPDMPFYDAPRYLIEAEEAIAPLFNRIVDSKFDASENEYRILARGPRHYAEGSLHIEMHNPMQVEVGESIYDVVLRSIPVSSGESKRFVELVFRDCESGAQHEMQELVNSEFEPNILPQFLDLDIKDTAVRYGYIGTKKDCREFIEAELSGKNKCLLEDENHHLHHGEWSNYMKVKPFDQPSHREDLIIRPPEEGYYN